MAWPHTAQHSTHQCALPSSVCACVCVCVSFSLSLTLAHTLTVTSYLRCSFSATILDYLDRVSDTSGIIICMLLAFRYSTYNEKQHFVCSCVCSSEQAGAEAVSIFAKPTLALCLFMCLMNSSVVSSVNNKCLINKKYTHIRVFGA